MHKYKQENKTCPNPPVKGSILCRKHRYTMKKNPQQYNILKDDGKINKRIFCDQQHEKVIIDDDASSILTIQEDETECDKASTSQGLRIDDGNISNTDDDIDLSKRFIFKCIDEYFEEHKKRDEYLKSFKRDDKKGGMDMNMLLSIGGMSLLPMFGKFIQNYIPNNNMKHFFLDRSKKELSGPKKN